jgi:hypothetical protein
MEEANEQESAKIREQSFKTEQEKAEWRMQANRDYKEQLEKDARFIEWSKEFNGHSVQSFIEDFARRKIRWYEWGAKYAEWQERDELQWQEQAFALLQEIQQKKLFDLQCQWRADKISLSGISSTYDFLIWEPYVLSCPLLEPISEDEADFYLQYLNSADYEFRGIGNWQDYKNIRTAYEHPDAGEHFPEWYSFVNSRKGTGFYLLLPDIRGEKENFYTSLYREHKAKNPPAKKASATAPPADRKPTIDYYKEGYLDWFIKTYETPEVFEYYKAVLADSLEENKTEVSEFLQDAIEILSKADRKIAIHKSDDWRQSLFESANEYRRQKLAEAFPEAYESYRMKLQGGIALSAAGPDIFDMMRQMKYEVCMNEILEGRVLNGEPKDFNF